MILKSLILPTLLFSIGLSASTSVDFQGNVKVLNNCILKKDIIEVDLGQARVSDFPSLSTSANSTPFSIPLDCKKGAAVKIKIETSSTFNASTGYMPFTSGNGTAKNIYLQLLRPSGESIIPGKLYSIVNASSPGTYEVNLIARFVRWVSVVSPGTASINLTFTLQYD